MSRAVRRARPALGTVVELGALAPERGREGVVAAFAEAWRVLAEVEGALTVFIPGSDAARLNAATASAAFSVGAHTAAVLRAALRLERESGGLFDVTLGTGPREWQLAAAGCATVLVKRSAAVRLDLGGIGRGRRRPRVLCARARSALGARAWSMQAVTFACAASSFRWRYATRRGGARPFLALRRGALATSRFGPDACARLAGAAERARHVTVLAPRCLWSDALTKSSR